MAFLEQRLCDMNKNCVCSCSELHLFRFRTILIWMALGSSLSLSAFERYYFVKCSSIDFVFFFRMQDAQSFANRSSASCKIGKEIFSWKGWKGNSIENSSKKKTPNDISKADQAISWRKLHLHNKNKGKRSLNKITTLKCTMRNPIGGIDLHMTSSIHPSNLPSMRHANKHVYWSAVCCISGWWYQPHGKTTKTSKKHRKLCR